MKSLVLVIAGFVTGYVFGRNDVEAFIVAGLGWLSGFCAVTAFDLWRITVALPVEADEKASHILEEI